MNDQPNASLRIGAWCVNPLTGQISQSGESERLEARTLRLLMHLATRAGEVVSIDELLDEVWAGVVVTPDSVYQAIATLRRALKDDPKDPAYIATVPRLGYRLVASVGPWDGDLAAAASRGTAPPVTRPATATGSAPPASAAPRNRVVGALVVTAILALAAVYGFASRQRDDHSLEVAASKTSPRSIGVVPFLDLTEGMKEETFADGMTEELIGKLSKVDGLKVPSPTASFYFKDKQASVGEIGRTLGVNYLLDGSVRKSGGRVRVAARLVRAGDGYVLWSENYDRPFDDILVVQDDIATEVRKALVASIDSPPRSAN